MTKKLQQGDRFLSMTFDLVGGRQATHSRGYARTLRGCVVLPRPLVTLLHAAVGRVRGHEVRARSDGVLHLRHQCGHLEQATEVVVKGLA